jgi:ribose-phosphate pyrophosphokinase
VVAVDLHSASSEAFFRMPLEHLTAVPILIEAIASDVPEDGVIIAPDLGAVKLAERYASSLRLPMAIVHKARISGEAVVTHGIVGEVTGRTPVFVDDMISTGATIEAAFAAARAAKSGDRCVVAATHGLFVGSAFERLRGLPVSALFVTDSLATTQNDVVPQQVVSLAPLLADAIRRLYEGRSLVDLIHHE